jgi:hypothetical protein
MPFADRVTRRQEGGLLGVDLDPPESGETTPPMILISVLLPALLSPRTAWIERRRPRG